MPCALDGVAVKAVREEWVIEDRWWTGRPLRRRYFELVLDLGPSLIDFGGSGPNYAYAAARAN